MLCKQNPCKCVFITSEGSSNREMRQELEMPAYQCIYTSVNSHHTVTTKVEIIYLLKKPIGKKPILQLDIHWNRFRVKIFIEGHKHNTTTTMSLEFCQISFKM